MKRIFHHVLVAAGVALSVATAVVVPSHAGESGILGLFGHRDPYDRLITVSPDTRSVNVIAGENVQFVERRTGQNFIRQFDNKEKRTYDIEQIAPLGMFTGQKIKVYVFARSRDRRDVLGRLGEDHVFNRTITVGPTTRWINVANGELVKIVDTGTGASFVWNFDNRLEWGHFDFATVAPPGMLSREHLIAYVAGDAHDVTPRSD